VVNRFAFQYTQRGQAATKQVLKKLPNGLKNDQRIKRIVPSRRDKTLSKNKAFKSVGRFFIRWLDLSDDAKKVRFFSNFCCAMA